MNLSCCIISNVLLPSEFIDDVLQVADELVINFSIPLPSEYLKEVIKQYSSRVVVLSNTFTNFAEFRNISIQHASGKWILILDSDEKLSQKLKEKIATLIKDDSYDVYRFHRIHFVNDPPPLIDYWAHTRLFKNYCRYIGVVHEHLVGYKNMKIIDDKDCYILHNNTRKDAYQKGLERLALLESQIKIAKQAKDADLVKYYQFISWTQKKVFLEECDKTLVKDDLEKIHRIYETRKKKYADIIKRIDMRGL